MSNRYSYSRPTWHPIWPGLLHEASRIALSEPPVLAQYKSYYASAIVLSRTAWEAFGNEFIQTRGLDVNLKGLSLRKYLRKVFDVLGQAAPDESPSSIFGQLILVGQLRNAIVHHKADPLNHGAAPSDLVCKLGELKLCDATASRPWEDVLLNGDTAKWSCRTVRNAILELDSFDFGRIRARTFVPRLIKIATLGLDK